MSRSASLSSENSTSTYATSYSSGEESDRCPSLVSPSSSSTSSQDISDNEQDHEERLMRMMIKSSPFPGASLLFDDDGEELGDLTVRPIDFDATLGLESEAPISSTPRKKTFDINSPTKTASKVTTAWSQEQLQQQQLKKKDALTTARKPAGHGRQESFSSSTTSEAPPIKANYTIHDNGNVGVLGGGVRLGGTSSSSHKKSRDNNSSHNPSKSSSYAGSYYRFPQPFDQAYYHGMGHYSAPTRTIPLPGTSGHLYPTQSYSSSNYLIHPSYPTILPYASYSPVNTIPQLPPPHGYHHRGSGHFGAAQYQQVPPSTFDAGGPNNTGGLARGFQAPSSLMAASGADSDTGDEPCLGGNTKEGGKRVRSRGRRSRGRGAGRAARRQAAALKALQEANPNMNLSSTLEDLRLSSLGLELESNRSGSALGSNYSFTTAGSNSRCSTPSPFNAESLSSSSEYASSSNSCFSSVSSTPAKLAACEVAKDRFNASRFLLPELGRKRMVGTDREDLDLDLDLNFCLNLGQIDLKLDAHSNMAHQSQQTNGEASSQAGVGYTGLTPTWSLTMATPRIGCV
ncbi:hypothetical protein IE53DRAFT_384177 [Violaceomyces palustris]|uniref:Uncharacterized protein n=1 Tax=Violaceomyces palustris TaxID=1673888 RepID=A0ACD0P5B4_9BASI|nr:hypothetical protein IE53DRAFT_384177 [Violaceomyces palustris]